MPLQIKRALAMPFNDGQSMVAFAIGTLLSLPAAYAQTFSKTIDLTVNSETAAQIHLTIKSLGAPDWVLGLLVVASFLSVGYIVRTMRAEFTNSATGASASLPSWGGNPVDLIVSFFANLVGGLLLALGAVAVVAFGCFLGAVGGILLGLGHSASYADTSGVILALCLVGGLVASPMAIFICMSMPMMQAHYACTDRFGAICEWRQIWRATRRKFWTIFGIGLVGGIAFGIVEAMASVWFPLVAVVSFYGSVVFANLFAQVYLAQTKAST